MAFTSGALLVCLALIAGGDPVSIQGQEIDKLFLENGKSLDRFGRAAAIHGGQLVVTSDEISFAGSPNTLKGAAYVYARGPAGWLLEQRLEAFDAEEFDSFGWSAAFDGTTIVTGAIGKQTAFGADAGAAYTFVETPSGWVSQGKLVPSAGSAGADFGYSVDVDGDTLIVGAFRENNGGFLSRGAAYVFVRRDGVWTEEARLLGHAQPFLFFGEDVQVRGDRAFVSTSAGARVYLFERSGTTWTQVDLIQPEVPAFGYGAEIAFDGETLWVGADTDEMMGSVFSYVHDGTSWVQEQRFFAVNPFVNQKFGWKVDVEGDWGVVSVRVGPGGPPGTVHVFQRQDGHWSEVGTFSASDDYPGLDFATSLAFDGSTVLSGAMLGIGVAAPDPTGAAYVHVLDLPPTTQCVAEPHSEGCVATIGWNGNASLSDPSPFDVSASDVATGRNGLFFYGLSGPAELAFGGGTLCVQPPLRRTTVQSSGGADGVPCDGAFAFDVNAWLQAGNEPLATPGLQVDGQYWFRDSGAPAGVGLTDSIRFFVNP